jgi:hypothetical protein
VGLEVIYNIPLLFEWIVELGASFVERPAPVVQPSDIQGVAEILSCFHVRLISKNADSVKVLNY